MHLLRWRYSAYFAITILALSACSGGEGDPGTPPPGSTPGLRADAGPDQSVFVGILVTLNGSKSTNANQTGLTYKWTLVKPTASNASLSNDTSVTPTLTVDVEGIYEATLIVTDARQTNLSSEPDTVQVTASKSNLPPTADPGDNQDVFVGRSVSLDGSGSRASVNKQLTFNWSFKNRPAGSTSTLSDPTQVNPSFTPDQSGSYVLQLIVNDGTKSSTPAEVTIAAAVKPRPTANAGPNQSAIKDSLVTLDGSKSFAADDGPLTYFWSLTDPQNNSATLTNADSKFPTFTANILGLYIATLKVNDGMNDSELKTVEINVSNTLPIAITEKTKTARLCHPVELDGSASTNRDGTKIPPLSYSWRLVSNLNGIAELANGTTVKPGFTAYLKGNYQINLVVSEGGLTSPEASVTVEAKTNYDYTLTPTLPLPATYTNCNGCHKVGTIDPSGSDDELSKSGRKVRDIFRDTSGQSIPHKNLSLTEDAIRDLCDFFQAN